jgi:hypothetical protein
MACDDEIILSQERIENVPDDADLETAYDTEPHLLLCRLHPRPRSPAGDWLKPASEFLDDLLN